MYVNSHSEGIRPQRQVYCFGPPSFSLKNHFLRYSLKVPDSLLSASVLEMCVHSTVCDSLSHSLAVLDEIVVCKSPVVVVVLLYPYVETCYMSLGIFFEYMVSSEVISDMQWTYLRSEK